MRECGGTVGEEAGEYYQGLALALRRYTELVISGIGYFYSGLGISSLCIFSPAFETAVVFDNVFTNCFSKSPRSLQ